VEDAMRYRIGYLLVVLLLSACQQLPPRTDGVSINSVPDLHATIIPSNDGLLSSGITKVPGSYCFAGDDGKCDPAKLSPAPCILNGATVEVSPATHPTPSYDSLIDNKYAATANVPFVSATTNAEYYDEVKASVVGTAQFSPTSPNNGYPGIEGLKQCILSNEGPGTYGTVYWISAANILDITLQHFVQVTNTDGVTATAFGLNGSTYNHTGTDQEMIYIGLQASPIVIGTIAPKTPQLSSSGHAVLLTKMQRGFDVQVATPEHLPASVQTSFIREP
jgi:hypothetical protein